MMKTDRTRWIIIGVALFTMICIFLYRFRSGEDKAFTSIAYPCLPLDQTTTDPATCIMVVGNRSPPEQQVMADGSIVYPVFSHPDPMVVPLVQGKTLYFPARFIAEDDLETPPLPPNDRPLSKVHRFELIRYLPEETKAALSAAVQGAAK
jgi:hypothetical protein